jgi:hypothetical protein
LALIREAALVTNLTETTLRQYARVARHCVQVEGLSFGHHIEGLRARTMQYSRAVEVDGINTARQATTRYGQVRPVRKISSSPEMGTVVIQVLEGVEGSGGAGGAGRESNLRIGDCQRIGSAARREGNVALGEVYSYAAARHVVPVKLALNQRKLPAGTDVPLKFDELFADAWPGGGGGGVEQLRVFGEEVMLTGPLSPTVTVPEKETLPQIEPKKGEQRHP